MRSVHFIGLDLAWGEKKPTGVAVLDADGRLLHVSAQRSDETILAALAPYVTGDCLVAIDAPLVVTNPTGNRPCEAELNRDFARFDAGAHPANTGKPEFATTPRGARVAAALGLDLDPHARTGRRAIEVYPHPATVALFRLGRTLKYKDRPGRTAAEMRTELLALTALIAGLDAATPALHVGECADWKALVASVEAAERKAELRRAEDQVDAVLCAYVGLFAERRPEDTTVYGDLATGFIVTPTLPDGHRPSPRARTAVEPTPEPVVEPTPQPVVEPASGPSPDEPVVERDPGSPAEPSAADNDPVKAAVREYATLQPALGEVTDRFVALVTTLLDDAGINYLSVTGRAKSVASFAAKAARTQHGRPVYADPLTEITDQIGIRVIAYLRSDVAAVADVLGDQLTVLDDRDMGQETARQGQFGYASRHLLVTLDPDRAIPAADPSLRGRPAQIQVRTVLQHAWAEFEHAIRYKGTVPVEHAPDLDRRFTLAAGLLELADQEFSAIRDRLQESGGEHLPEQDVSDPRISPQELATFLAAEYADAGWSRTDHYAWISGLLLELGITSLAELAGLLTSVDGEAIIARMGYKYAPGAVRRLDDALLAIFGERYLDLHGNAHRRGLLQARLAKLAVG